LVVQSRSDNSQQSYETLLKFVYAIVESEMAHSLSAWRARPPSGLSLPSGSSFSIAADVDPLKIAARREFNTTGAALRQFRNDALLANPPLPFEALEFGELIGVADDDDVLVDASWLDTPSIQFRSRVTLYFYVEQPGTVQLLVQGGLIAHYRDRGPVKLSLYAQQNQLVEEPVDQDLETAVPDGVVSCKFIDRCCHGD
jgi:hypothetical protein